MKVLVIASFPDSLLEFRGPLLAAMLEKKLEVHVAAPDIHLAKGMQAQLVRQGIMVHDIELKRTGTNPLNDLKTLWRLYMLMRHIRPHVVLGYTIKPVIYGILSAWLAGVPRRFALVTGLGYAFTGESRGLRRVIRWVVQGLYRFALSHTSKAFFQNPDDQALFRSLGLLPLAIPSCVVNGSGVDVSAFPVAPLPSAPCFLLIARLLGDKGVREYALAAQRIRLSYPAVRFSLVGWIDENPNAISQKELDAWVKAGTLDFWGRLSDVRPAIEACSVYVLPSYREGTPRTVLEAMAMGRAVITTDAPGCRETVVEGESGFLVPIKSVDALVEAMTRFITDPTLVTRMGERGRQIAEEKYDVHKVNVMMLKEMGLA